MQFNKMNWLLKTWNLATLTQRRAMSLRSGDPYCLGDLSAHQEPPMPHSCLTHELPTGWRLFGDPQKTCKHAFIQQASIEYLPRASLSAVEDGYLCSVKLLQVGRGRDWGRGFYSPGRNQQTWIMTQSHVVNMNCSYTVSILLGLKYKDFRDKWSSFESWLCHLLVCAVRQVV